MMRGDAAVVAGEPPPEDDSGALHGALRPAILSREAPRTTSPATRVDDELRPSGVRSAIAPRVPNLLPPAPPPPHSGGSGVVHAHVHVHVRPHGACACVCC